VTGGNVSVMRGMRYSKEYDDYIKAKKLDCKLKAFLIYSLDAIKS
jgi:hypothetical protein